MQYLTNLPKKFCEFPPGCLIEIAHEESNTKFIL